MHNSLAAREHGDEPLIAALRAAFAAHADAAQAAPMQAYMKSALPFYGIAAPLRRKLTADVVKTHPATTTAALARTMTVLWREARFREERYAAVELPRLGRAHPKLVHFELLPVVQMMITSGAWWDLVDDLSGNVLARLLERHPAEMKPLLRRLGARRRPVAAPRGDARAAQPR